jgi:hypothetical protein
MHITEHDDGRNLWENKERFMCVYKTYGRRIINGFNDKGTAESLFAVDKEALLNCLLECRTICRKELDKNSDILLKHLMRYT